MENKIKITPTTTLAELTEIFTNNEPEDAAKAVRNYIEAQTHIWYEQYDRANKAEKELAEANAAILNWAIKQMNQ